MKERLKSFKKNTRKGKKMIKELEKLEKKFQKSQTKDNLRGELNGVYYPRESQIGRVMTDGNSLLINNIANFGKESLLGSGKLNSLTVDLIGGEALIDLNFPDFLRVIPQEIKQTFKISFPEWIKDLKTMTEMCIDLDNQNLCLLPTSENYVRIDLSRFNWLAGWTVQLGIRHTRSPIAVWSEGLSYNPLVNPYTFVLMPLKDIKEGKGSKFLEKVEINSGTLETV